MATATRTYRMRALMDFTEIDAFSALKNAGSKSQYFGLLSEFTDSAPPLLKRLRLPDNPSDTRDYFDAIDKLQLRLLAIGASAMMYEAEKAAEYARNEDSKECASVTNGLIAKVEALCARIAEVEIPGGEAPEAAPAPARTAAPAARLVERGAIKAVAKSEPFEKLALLTENFEIDEAIVMLQSIMRFSYGDTIDPKLQGIMRHLENYDYDASAARIHEVIDTIAATERGAAKAEKKKILAIDDMPDVLNTVKSVLKDRYTVYGVANHMAALKFLTSNSADLILLDIEMPDMNGFALLSVIRKIEAYQKTPVLFLTGSVSVENIKKAVDAGGNDFIRKPVDVGILLAKIQSHIGV